VRWIFLVLGIAIGFGLALAFLRDALESVEPEIASSAPIPENEFMRDYSERDHPVWGRVVMDVRGVEFESTVCLLGKTVFGAPLEYYDSLEEYDDGVVSVEGRAGRYLAWWWNKDAERVGVRVLVESGRETRITPEQGKLLPLGDGLGRLDVRFVGWAGAPLAVLEVELKGNGADEVDETYVLTTSTGRCRFEILPGDYYLEIGHAILEASVRRGETTQLEVAPGVRPSGYGDLEVERAPNWISFELVTENGARIDTNGGDGVFRFIDPGTYKLVGSVHQDWHTGHKRDLATIEIRPNECTRIDCPIPTGALSVQLESDVTSPNTSVLVAVSRDGDAGSKTSKVLLGEVYEGATTWSTFWLARKRGNYAITVTGAEWKTVKTAIAVADGFSDVVLRMTRK
jgi:hypothetical protein